MIGADAVSAFRDAIRAAGLSPPDTLEPGRFHRFPGEGKANGNKAGWCKLFADARGGIFGDFATGAVETWQAAQSRPLTLAEREAFRRNVEENKARAEAKCKAEHLEAACMASERWSNASHANPSHPYLRRKGIKPHSIRQEGDALLIPMRHGTDLHSLQTIGADGDKRFLAGGRVAGCYFSIGKPGDTVCIAEGYATGATIHEATGYPVAVAFSAGNLEAVARTLRVRYPDAQIILCADDDCRTASNPGKTKATEAARAVGGLLAVPDFGPDRPEGATDFNDLARHRGAEAVERAISDAKRPDSTGASPATASATTGDPEGWPEPLPLVAKVSAEPYPVDALPATIRASVEEVQGFTKAPAALVASSALAALSVAVQAHVDVQRANALQGPVSLFLLTIADSGERKSTCDGFFSSAIRDYQMRRVEAAKPELAKHRAEVDAWKAKRDALTDAIRSKARKGEPTTGREQELRDLETDKPETPRVPRLLRGDETPEALAWALAHEWPSAGVVSAEAGSIFGAHGMGRDSIMRYLALLNIVWDGGTLPIGRRTSESFTVRGARLTIGLQVQEATLRAYLDRSDGLPRGTGFLARCLVAWPESTQGYRPFTEPPKLWPARESFNRRIAELLEQPVPIGLDGTLTPMTLTLAPNAKAAWEEFHDAIEQELRGGGELCDVRDVASKAADNAARMAALFQVFEHGAGAVRAECFEAASRIVAWHLNEARRFLGELALPAELVNPARLDSWLLDYCRREKTASVPSRAVQQFGPGGLRDKGAIEAAVRELDELGRARLAQDGRRKVIHVNPALLDRIAP